MTEIPLYYILDGKIPKPCRDMEEWARKFDIENRIVAHDTISDEVDQVLVSTVFLGIDHAIPIDGRRPILFESMVFGGILDGEMARYSTWQEAENGHAELLERVRLSVSVG